MSSLDYPFRDHEIVKEIFSIKPFKSVGPDDLHPYF